MAAVRARGWTDPLWEEVGRLRMEADAVRIFRAFDGEGEEEGGAPLRFPGEVLRWLMNLTPYPVPANRPAVYALLCCSAAACCRFVCVCVWPYHD
jgi:hypothetical protein